jgi:MFS family permease
MAQVAALDQNTPADNQSVTIHSAADVSRLVNAGSDHRSHARIIIAIALGGVFLDAYDLGAMAFGVKDIAREFALTPAGIGMVTSAITFGAIVGAFFGGYLTDKIGRYRVFMADMFFFVIAALACAIAPNAWILGGARFVMGLGVGIDLPVAMAFLAEFSRLKGRGNKASSIAMWCPTWYAAISISYMLVLALYTALPAEQTHWLWRLILGFGAVPALAIIIIRSRYISESPVWAANQGDLAGAARIQRNNNQRRCRWSPAGVIIAGYCKAFICGAPCWRPLSRSRPHLPIMRWPLAYR